ncbi:MAG: type II toxin-antitoxin system RelE/ParE family toxin [Desulfobacula sp.]|uniref:type II toxin-antitoxin system RelE family toxin n=1 Tax=Desulfobacula sp. TaxID=2593537 RepID=UPI0025C3D9F0|nr:type II toxin-antitoxin system RelE/ParE family toxin [Desulfobacula sp.]MCD4720399.1 type II toxin-antitoxin system RelE/ParE family toxin [Desulfobacula sp.]
MYRVKLTPTAGLMFNNLHPTIKRQLKSILKGLYENPYLGKELRDELVDFRSLRIKRYRAIYQIDNRNKEVIIYAIGHRRNIYEIINKLATKP